MSNRHDILHLLPPPLAADAVGNELRLSLPEGRSEHFLLVRVPSLTRKTAKEIVDRSQTGQARPCFISFDYSSPDGRAALRNAGISFAGEDGHVFVRAPGILVERELPTRASSRPPSRVGSQSQTRNPFARRSSRVPRWLLLHPEEVVSPTAVAKAVDLNPAAVSRILHSLHDAAFLDEGDSTPRQRRALRLARPRELLEAWLPLWQRRRVAQYSWDIGTRAVEGTIDALLEAAGEGGDWAVGGLAGAERLARAVEPADVLVWTTEERIDELARALAPEPVQPGAPGALRVAVAPDPWTLRLARRIERVPIADPVQLWLDTASRGERALEAADAVAARAGWS
jgi:hypothetical protein